MRTPDFWKYRTLISSLLLPASLLYSLGVMIRIALTTPQKFPVHIICIGNLVAGGAGKTPVAISLGKLLKAQGKKAFFLSRGYKSQNSGTLKVDKTLHTALEVGDEPLLLAEVLPTIVSKNRIAGIEAAIKQGAEIIIMDDGFQNPTIHKDVSLLVIDGMYGFGNQRLIPAGPMRETIKQAVKRASCLIMMGEDEQQILTLFPDSLPVLYAKTTPVIVNPKITTENIIAFCAIARPRKFYRTLQEIGCQIKETFSYPDHYVFKKSDLDRIVEKARIHNALMVTTEKDFVKLPAEMQLKVTAIPITVTFADESSLLQTALLI